MRNKAARLSKVFVLPAVLVSLTSDLNGRSSAAGEDRK